MKNKFQDEVTYGGTRFTKKWKISILVIALISIIFWFTGFILIMAKYPSTFLCKTIRKSKSDAAIFSVFLFLTITSVILSDVLSFFVYNDSVKYFMMFFLNVAYIFIISQVFLEDFVLKNLMKLIAFLFLISAEVMAAFVFFRTRQSGFVMLYWILVTIYTLIMGVWSGSAAIAYMQDSKKRAENQESLKGLVVTVYPLIVYGILISHNSKFKNKKQ